MRHVGEEFRLGAVGRLGALLLGLIIGIRHRKLGLLPLQFGAGGREVADGRHQAALGFAQAHLMTLHHGDVGADGDEAAIARAPLVDLKPAFVGELHFARL